MSRLISAMLQPVRFISQGLYSVSQSTNQCAGSLVKPNNFLISLVRNKVRCYFPRPNEVKRVRRHGWNTRISTPNGRRVIMRRLLKGRYVLTH